MNADRREAVNATVLLTRDHERVRQLKRDYEATRASAARRDIAHDVFRALEIHAAIEEKIFYPAVAAAMGREGQRLVAEAVAEHVAVKNAIAALRSLALGDADFEARFLSMLADVDHHATEEEREMLPRAEAALGAELDALGARMAMLENTLLTSKRQAGAA